MKPDSSPKILVVRLSSLGDVILASSVPLALKEAVPGAKITFLTRDSFADVFKNNPAVDDVISFAHGEHKLNGISAVAREARSRRFDLILDLQCNPRTSILCVLARPRACKRSDRDVVTRHAMVRFKSFRPRRVRHSVQRFLRAVERAFGPVQAARPRLFLTDEEMDFAEEFVSSLGGQGKRPLVGLCPGAKWETKRWGVERVGLLAQKLHEIRFDVCVVGGETDRAVLQKVESCCESLEGVRFHSGDLRSLAALLERCDCVVSNDSGLMHVAHAVGTPVVALFGSTVPEFGFYPPDSCSTVISNSFDCKPCDVHGKNSCNEGDMRCMESIEVVQVVEEVQRILKGARRVESATRRRLELPRFVLARGRAGPSDGKWSVPPSGAVVVRVPNWVGDAVMAGPSLAALRECARGIELVAVAHERVAGIFEQSGLVDEYVRVGSGGVTGLLRAAMAVRKYRCVAGVAMPDSYSSALMFWLGGVKKIVGFKGELRDGMLAVRLERERWKHLCEQYAQLLPSGCTASGKPRLTPSSAELERARDLLCGAGVLGSSPFALLAPGATYGETKRWPGESFARLGELLRERAGFHVVLLGSRADGEFCGRVAERSRVPMGNLSGKTSLRELAAVASLGTVFVGNDSGAVHVAAASGCPVVVVFGSSDPSWTAPRGDAVSILYNRLSCSPCFRKKCPYELQCLRQIGVEDVYRAAMGLSENGRQREEDRGQTQGGSD